MNKIIVSGNLTREGELSFAAGTGNAILKFTVACARGFKKEDGTDFINCVLFGKRAEGLAAYLVKGVKVIVEGSLRLGSYEAKDGTKKYTTDIIVSNVEMIGGKGQQASNETASDSGYDDIQPVDDGIIPF